MRAKCLSSCKVIRKSKNKYVTKSPFLLILILNILNYILKTHARFVRTPSKKVTHWKWKWFQAWNHGRWMQNLSCITCFLYYIAIFLSVMYVSECFYCSFQYWADAARKFNFMFFLASNIASVFRKITFKASKHMKQGTLRFLFFYFLAYEHNVLLSMISARNSFDLINYVLNVLSKIKSNILKLEIAHQNELRVMFISL